jgi:hypothetical protein
VNKKYVYSAVFGLAVLAGSSFWVGKELGMKAGVTQGPASAVGFADEAFLALIKNDQASFERIVNAGGDLHSKLPVIDGKTLTVAQGLSYFERPGFMRFLQASNKAFVKQDGSAEFDIMTLAVPKNNPELFALLLKEKPALAEAYGSKGYTLLHLASAACAHKLVPLLHQGSLSWNTKAKDGSTPLTLAAQSECLPALGYWKDQKADFNLKDGRGNSAMSLLRKNKDAAILAFVQSFEVQRTIASVGPTEMSLYRKRVQPKVKLIDDSTLLEPEARPVEANETAEYSEFSD